MSQDAGHAFCRPAPLSFLRHFGAQYLLLLLFILGSIIFLISWDLPQGEGNKYRCDLLKLFYLAIQILLKFGENNFLTSVRKIFSHNFTQIGS